MAIPSHLVVQLRATLLAIAVSSWTVVLAPSVVPPEHEWHDVLKFNLSKFVHWLHHGYVEPDRILVEVVDGVGLTNVVCVLGRVHIRTRLVVIVNPVLRWKPEIVRQVIVLRAIC